MRSTSEPANRGGQAAGLDPRARVNASAPGECRKPMSHQGSTRAASLHPCAPLVTQCIRVITEPLPLLRRSNIPAVACRLFDHIGGAAVGTIAPTQFCHKYDLL